MQGNYSFLQQDPRFLQQQQAAAQAQSGNFNQQQQQPSQPFLNTFMPTPDTQQPIGMHNFQPSQMQFAQPTSQFSGMSLQQTFQQQNQQQIGQAEVKVPWKLSTEEKKSYDQIFRAWDQTGSGFIEGKMSTEVFAQSGLPREDLMQIWLVREFR
jgi:hypothetical protein